MKKLLSFILAAIMLLSLCACAGNDAGETTEATQATEEATEPEETTPDETKVDPVV